MNCYTREQIEAAVIDKGYKWFTGDNYDVNIVGVRNGDTAEITNRFDDCITISYKDENGEWNFHCFQATTDPGTHWARTEILNKDGVAILKEGQYRGSHKVGLHRGKYEALRQKKAVKVYRDGNKDDVYDFIDDDVHEGIYGINIHRATAREGGESTRVDKWSAGCQVFAANDDFKLFMDIVNKAKDAWGNSFTYTLINSEDINE